MVIWVKTELTMDVCSKGLVRGIDKVVLFKIGYDIIKFDKSDANWPMLQLQFCMVVHVNKI